MKMALPRGMYPHPKTGVYWVRKDVPRDLQGLVGKTSLKLTLGTKDRRKADALFHDVMKQFVAQIDAAKTAKATGKSMPTDYSNVVIEIEPQFQAGMKAIYETSPQGQIAKMREELAQAGLSKPKREAVSMKALFERWIVIRIVGEKPSLLRRSPSQGFADQNQFGVHLYEDRQNPAHDYRQ